MHRFHSLLIILPAALLVAGCGSEAPQEPSDVTVKTLAEEEKAATVFDPMLESLERAKGVEDMAAQRKAEMDERIRKETAGDSPD